MARLGMANTAALVCIPQATMYNWKRKRAEGKDPLPKGKRQGGGKKPLLSKSEEEELAAWLIMLQDDGLAITRSTARAQGTV
jgi:transposase